MPANGTHSIYYKDISNNTIGRLFGSQLQMYMDYYNIMSFRNCTRNGSVTGVKLILNDKGIVINSSTTSSNFNLDVYGNGGAYIRGPLRVLNDILYSDSVSLVSTLGGYNSSINTLSGRIFTISGGLHTLSGLVNTNTNTSSITTLSGQITSISGRLNTATTDITSIRGRLNTATTNITTISGLINTATTNITTISGLINTATTNITTISGLINTATTDITSISGRLNTLSGTVNTINTTVNSHATKLTKINYVSSNNNTFISSIPTTFTNLNYADGGLIMHNTSPIWNRVAVQQYTGNGFFYNTNGGSRTDFINYLGNANASTSIGGFEFWIGSLSFAPYVVATINYLGSLSISEITTTAIVATTNITSPLLTATTRVITPYITVNSLYNIGTAITISSNITLTFPLPEIIFCNCTSNAINITLPNIATLAASSTCRIQIRRILNTANQINLLCFGSQSRMYISNNTLGTAANAIGNNCQLLLNGNFWYQNTY